MATTIDQRVVEMRFDNAQFERNVQQSIDSLDELDRSIETLEGTDGLSSLSTTVNKVSYGFSSMGAVAFTAIQRITNAVIDLGLKIGSKLLAPMNQMASGGWARAMNIEQAKFQFEGLGIDVETAMKSASDAVQDTAYSLDAAAKVAGMLGTSGMKAGDEMTKALTAVSGVAAQTMGSYEDIGNIFTDIAAAGKVTGDSLTRLAYRGLNAKQVLADALGTTTAEVTKMASKGKISFKQFYDAMYDAFGEHAYKANETYAGSLANVNAALSKIGADFQQHKIQNMVKVFNSLRKAINLFRVELTPLSKVYGEVSRVMTSAASGFIDKHAPDAAKALGIALEGLSHIFENLLYIIKIVSASFKDIFPEALGFKLSDVAERFKAFAEGLKITDEMARKIAATFNGIFSLFGIFKLLIEAIVKAIFPTADGFNSLADAVLTFTGYLGSAISALYKWLKESNALYNVAQGIKLAFTVIISVLMIAIDKIYELYKAISTNETVIYIFGLLKKAAVTAFQWIASAIKTVIVFIKAFKSETESLGKSTADGVGNIIEWFSGIIKSLKAALKEVNATKAGMFLAIGFIAALATIMISAAVKLAKGIRSLGGAFKGFSNFLSNFQNGLLKLHQSAQLNKKIRNFIIIVSLFVLLARELRKLAEIDDSGQIWSAAGALFVVMNAVAAIGIAATQMFRAASIPDADKKFDPIVKLFNKMALLIATIALSTKLISSGETDKLYASAIAIGGVMAVIGGIVSAFSAITKTNANPQAITKISIVLVAIAGAILAIGKAVSMMTGFRKSWQQIAASTLGITAVLGALGGLVIAFEKIPMSNTGSLPGKIASLLLLTVSLIPIGIALKIVEKQDWKGILASSGAISGCLIVLSGMMYGLAQSTRQVSSGRMAAAAASMLVMCLSLIPVAIALNKLKTFDWESMWQTLILVSSVLAVAGGLMVALGEFSTSSAYASLGIGIAATAYITFGAALMLAGKGVLAFADAFSVMTREVNFEKVAGGLLTLEYALNKFSFSAVSTAALLSGTIVLAGYGLGKFAEGLAKLSSVDIDKIADGINAVLTSIAGNREAFTSLSVELDTLAFGLSALAPALQSLALPALAFAVAFTIASVGMLAFAGALRLATPALEAFQYFNWEVIEEGLESFAKGIRKLAVSSMMLSMSAKGLGIAALALGGFALEALAFQYLIDTGEVAAKIIMLGKACAYVGVQSVQMLASSLAMGVMAAAIYLLNGVISTAAEQMPQNIVKIANSLKGMANVGYYAAAGFANGVLAGIKDVVGSGLKMSSSFVEAVCKYLQIASPSELMRAIGEFTGSGFILGIADKMEEAEKSGTSVAAAAFEGVTEQLPLFQKAGEAAAQFFNNGLSAGLDWALGTYSKAGNKTNMSERGYTSSGYVKATSWSDRLLGKVKDFGKDMFGLEDVMEKFTEATTGAGGAADGLAESLDGAGGSAKSAKKEMDSLKDTIKNQINLFEEFNKETDLTADKLLENMKSQISGAAEWTSWIHQLGERGASSGLLKKLADMGQQNGYKYAKAFMDMSADQLAQANVFYASSLTIPDNAMFAIQDSFAMAGEWAAYGFANGITPDAAKEEVTLLGLRSLEQLKATLAEKSPSKETEEIGMYYTKGFARGILSSSPMQLIKYNITDLGNRVLAQLKKVMAAENFKSIGEQVINGIKMGINDSKAQGSLMDSVLSVCKKVKDAATSPKGFWEQSPSKVFEQIGSYVTLGLAKGISETSYAPVDSILGVTDDVRSGMRTAVDRIIEACNSELDLSPTIRPVVDLTDIDAGINTINNMMPASRIRIGSTSSMVPSNVNSLGGNGDVVAAITSLQEDVNYLGEAISNIKMVLDTGTMVGAMTPAIDQQLYTRQVYAGRGI